MVDVEEQEDTLDEISGERSKTYRGSLSWYEHICTYNKIQR
jgi:hypothetical protein